MKNDLLIKATELAFEAHKGQFRKGTGIPYINHLCEVTRRVAHYIKDIPEDVFFEKFSVTQDEVLAASMLHDYIEDCDGEYDFLKSEFSEGVAILVQECSREANHETKELKFEFLLSFKSKSSASILIKIADRYCNVMDYDRTKGKKKYASKYALQAYTLYSEFFDRELDFKFAFLDINSLRLIAHRQYSINIFLSNKEDEVRTIVT